MRQQALRESLGNLRFIYDSELAELIRTRFGEWIDKREDQTRSFLDTRRRELIGNTMCVTAELVPSVFEAFRSCVELLTGTEMSGSLYVQQSQEFLENPSEPTRGMHTRQWQLCALTALLYASLDTRSGGNDDCWQFISGVHSALGSDLPIGSMFDAVAQDCTTFRKSAISDIRNMLEILDGSDTEKIIRLVALMQVAGKTPVQQPSMALQGIAALLKVTNVDTIVGEVDTDIPLAKNISMILHPN